MTPNTFPYLTPDTLSQIGVTGLKMAAERFPNISAILTALALLLPIIEHVPAAYEAALHLCDEANHWTGAQAPTV